MCKTDSQWEFEVWYWDLHLELSDNPEGRGGEVGGRFKREGSYVHPWLSHADIWQKLARDSKAITRQYKIKIKREIGLYLF